MKTSIHMVALAAVVAASSASDFLCSTWTGSIDCSGRDITQPPSGVWPDVGKLTLSHTQVEKLYRNSFSGFPTLHVLHMENTPLKELDMDVFEVATEYLQDLKLENNAIESVVSSDRRLRFKNLQYVYLNNNNISSLDANAFRDAPKLQYVFLNKNPIQGNYIEDPILVSDTLQGLRINHGASLGDLGKGAFMNLPKLKDLKLEDAGITSIKGAFAYIEEAVLIDLSNNSITEVTKNTFASNQTILLLLLDNNPLQELPPAAVNFAVSEAGNAEISFKNTPLACSCGFEALYWWALHRRVTLDASCEGHNECVFTRRAPLQP